MNERRKSMRELETVEKTQDSSEDLVLERKAGGEILDELLLMEMNLLRRYKAHLARAEVDASSTSSPTKARIVEALRDKQS